MGYNPAVLPTIIAGGYVEALWYEDGTANEVALLDNGNIRIGNRRGIRTAQSNIAYFTLEAYDLDDATYTEFIRLTAGNTPTCNLAAAVTCGGKYIYREDGTDVPVKDGGTGLSTIAINRLLYASNTDVIAGLATGNNGVLVTNGTGVPSIATDLPTAVTIGTAYITRVGGTDVTLADGGTNASLTAANGGIVYSTASALAILAATTTATCA